jgi:uncharacterized protein YkwD
MTLTPILVGVGVVLACILAGPASASAAPIDDTQLLAAMNAERQAHGLRPLHRSPRLARAARDHARRLVAGRTFAHGDVMARVRDSGYGRGARDWRAGENLAWTQAPTARAVVEAWLASPSHRRILLDPGFRDVGLGIADGTPVATPGATVTADFGSRS